LALPVEQRAAFSGLVNRKLSIHRLFARETAGFCLARAGLAVVFNDLGRGSHSETGKYYAPKRTASEPSSRASTRTCPPRKPERISLRAI